MSSFPLLSPAASDITAAPAPSVPEVVASLFGRAAPPSSAGTLVAQAALGGVMNRPGVTGGAGANNIVPFPVRLAPGTGGAPAGIPSGSPPGGAYVRQITPEGSPIFSYVAPNAPAGGNPTYWDGVDRALQTAFQNQPDATFNGVTKQDWLNWRADYLSGGAKYDASNPRKQEAYLRLQEKINAAFESAPVSGSYDLNAGGAPASVTVDLTPAPLPVRIPVNDAGPPIEPQARPLPQQDTRSKYPFDDGSEGVRRAQAQKTQDDAAGDLATAGTRLASRWSSPGSLDPAQAKAAMTGLGRWDRTAPVRYDFD